MQSNRAAPEFLETAPAIQIQQLQEGANNWRRLFGAVMAGIVIVVWGTYAEHSAHEHQLALRTVAERDANLATSVDLYAVRVFRNARAVLQPFRRMHSTSEFPGSGVGLATVQRILALHGGKVWVQAAPKQGATFFFTLRDVPTA